MVVAVQTAVEMSSNSSAANSVGDIPVCYRGCHRAGLVFSTSPPVFSVHGRQFQARTQPMQPFQVVSQADQGPFQRHFFPATQPKLPEPQN